MMGKLLISSLPRSRKAVRSMRLALPSSFSLLLFGLLLTMYLAWLLMVMTWSAQDHCSFWTEPPVGSVKPLHAVYVLYGLLITIVVLQLRSQSWIESVVQLGVIVCFVVAIEGLISVTADEHRLVGSWFRDNAVPLPSYWHLDPNNDVPRTETTCGPMPPGRP